MPYRQFRFSKQALANQQSNHRYERGMRSYSCRAAQLNT